MNLGPKPPKKCFNALRWIVPIGWPIYPIGYNLGSGPINNSGPIFVAASFKGGIIDRAYEYPLDFSRNLLLRLKPRFIWAVWSGFVPVYLATGLGVAFIVPHMLPVEKLLEVDRAGEAK